MLVLFSGSAADSSGYQRTQNPLETGQKCPPLNSNLFRFSCIGSTRAKLFLWNCLVSSTPAPLPSGQAGEQLQNPDLVLHSGLLPPLLPLSHLPLPALLPLQPLGQELLMPASLVLPLILQLHEEAPRVRHQPLEAVREVPEDGLQAAGVRVVLGGGREGGGAGVWRGVERRCGGSVNGGRGVRGCYSRWGGSARAGFPGTFKTGHKAVQINTGSRHRWSIRTRSQLK